MKSGQLLALIAANDGLRKSVDVDTHAGASSHEIRQAGLAGLARFLRAPT